jgi:hypothetical protein
VPDRIVELKIGEERNKKLFFLLRAQDLTETHGWGEQI